MFAARLSQCVPLTAFVTNVGSKPQSVKSLIQVYNTTRVQMYATKPKASRFMRRQQAQETQSLKERAMAPAGEGGKYVCLERSIKHQLFIK